MCQTYELIPRDGRKSFYCKARVRVYEDGTKVLTSYTTDVCSIDASGGFHRHWGGWSATTARHISAFVGFSIPKAEWCSLPVEPLTIPGGRVA